MAASLLRLGRLGSVKCLLREGWGTPRTPFVAALCTKGDVPPKTAKKAKAPTLEADERASLLAYKPTVAFPSKLSATGFLPKDVALGESKISEAAANETTAGGPVADTAAAEEAKITEVPPTNEVTTKSEGSKASDVEAEVQKDQDDSSSSSSSSSSSDSDSDSDSDDEKPKTETPESGDKAAEEKKSSSLTNDVNVADKKAKPESVSFGEVQESAETVTKAKPKKVPAPSAKSDGSDETLIDPAPILSSPTTEAIPEAASKSITTDTPDKIDTATKVPVEKIVVEKKPEIKAEDAVRVAAEVVPEASPEEAVKTVEASPGVAPAAPGDVAPKPEDASFKAEAGTQAAHSEELVDPAPVAADAVEARAETNVVETPEEQAPEKAPEPEPEPFDNTTYKNLQHHNYNMYTFVDMDVEMSKHRLPQPSSGRPSPRH
ncbi:hypothetical protein Q8A67_007096 [Cirrhinus molitorella]|uniref:NADH dehydrogenase [ubiquinone] flavoprotein 3, mitochondrial n=1 Tax=Cirrhinus molitorella TaxID=172907 RepID=A0AA88Q390_9TELE|nr:hypothetical protein Q8A67_007096 [Cirrhinus molitorella]